MVKGGVLGEYIGFTSSSEEFLLGETFILRARRVLIKELSLVVCLPVPQEDVSQRTASCFMSFSKDYIILWSAIGWVVVRGYHASLELRYYCLGVSCPTWGHMGQHGLRGDEVDRHDVTYEVEDEGGQGD